MKTRKVFYSLVALIFLVGLVAVLAARPSAAQPSDPVEVLRQQTDGTARVSYHAETGKVRFIGTDQSHPIPQPVALQAGATAEEAARQYLSAYGSWFGLSDQGQELTVERSMALKDGRSVVRFQQVYQGIPVLGGELIVNLNAEKNVLSVSGETLPDIKLDTTASLGADAARQQAIAMVAKTYAVGVEGLTTTTPELWVLNPVLLGGPGLHINTLVWRMDVTPNELLPIKELVLVEAHTGAVVLHFNQIDTARNRETYDANNGTTLPGTLVCNEADPNCAAGAGDNDVQKAHIYAGSTYDFYASYTGRDSIDNAGMTIKSSAHYSSGYENAFWNGSQMVYGDAYGFANADDVIGHELTHGVTDYESSLFYYYQSGAINESFSDVWGEFVDLWNGLGDDSSGVRWLMGEDVTGLGAIRSMSDPTAFGDPDRMGSPYYYCADSHAWDNDNGGVHANSGVNNKAAYLMTDGGSFNGQTVSPLGMTKVADFYYEVQTHLFTTGSDYQDLYDSLIQACTNLIGTDGITAADCQEVQEAVTAVEMNTQAPLCEAPDAPVCAVDQTPSNIFFDNLENIGSGNWSHSAVSGSVDEWYYPQNPNSYWDATYGTSGVYNFFGIDFDVKGDYAMAMNNNVTLPSGTSYLRFNHAYGFEGVNFDGGVLEYSANGGAWTDVNALPSENGYNGTISSSYDNPLGGRAGFTSVSYGYTSSRLNLSSLAGQNVKFRFRIGTDSGGWDLGWYIDDIRIYTCQSTIPTSTPTRTPTKTVTPTGWTPLPTEGNFLPHVRKDRTPTPTRTATPSPTAISLPNILYSVADSSIIQVYGGSNYGGYVDMLVGHDKNYYSPSLKAVRSMVAFDVSAIPAGTTISHATLNVFFEYWLDYSGRSRTITTYRITSGWSELGVTWNNQPSTGQTFGSAAVIANSNWRYVSFDVTALVQAWVNGSYPNYGIMLRGPESAVWLRGFYARESSYPPYLNITYSGAAPVDVPLAIVENPEGNQGPSFNDLFQGATEKGICIDELTECYDHR